MANMKRNSIELVKAVKEGELDTERYLTPLFISYKLTYEAVDLMEVWRTNPEKKKEKDVFEETADFVARVYGEQFTKEELLNGLHGPEMPQRLFEQVSFIARGEQDSDTKKFLSTKKR